MALGMAQSKRFRIGVPEVRIGPMSRAGKLVQTDSVGLLESAEVMYDQTAVDLKGGLPKKIIDTTITELGMSVTAQAYEYSHNNILVMTNGLLTTAPTEVKGTVTTAIVAGFGAATSVVTDLTGIVAGDIVGIYPAGKPEQVSLIVVTAEAAGTLTFDPLVSPLLYAVPAGSLAFRTNHIGLGNQDKTNYFTMDIIGKETTTGRPYGFRFWKCSIKSGMQYSLSSAQYSATPLSFNVLEPSVDDYTDGGDLFTAGVQSLVPLNPFGMIF